MCYEFIGLGSSILIIKFEGFFQLSFIMNEQNFYFLIALINI